MVDTYARMRQLIGSSAEWIANDIVLGQGEIGIEILSDNYARVKVGDGASFFSNCPVVQEINMIFRNPSEPANTSVIKSIDGAGQHGLEFLGNQSRTDGGWIRATVSKLILGSLSNTGAIEIEGLIANILDYNSTRARALWTPREINKSTSFTFALNDLHNNTIILEDSLTGTLDTTLGNEADRINIFTQDATGFELVSNGGSEVIEWQQGGTSVQRTNPTAFSIAAYSVVHLQKSSDNFWFMWGMGIS